MKHFKQILAVLALLSMLAFLVSTVAFVASGSRSWANWIYLSLSAFLFLGVGCLVIHQMMKQREEKLRKEQEREEPEV